MTFLNFATKRDADSGAQPFFAAALVGCCLIVGGMAAATLVSDRQNRAASEAETKAVREALAGEADAIGMQLRAFAATASLPDSAEAYQALSGPFQHLFMVDTARPRAATAPSDQLRDSLDELLRTQGQRNSGASAPGALMSPLREADRTRAELVRVGDQAYLAVFVGADRSDKRPVDLVAMEMVGDPTLAKIARIAGTRPISLVRAEGPGSDAGFGLPIATSGPGLALTWAAERPGDRLFRTSSGILATLGALFAVFFLLTSRRVTRTLAESEARAKADASHDLLTGLSNRTAFSRHLQREIEQVSAGKGNGFALIYLDIDRFKEVNDTFGHGAGDTVISVAAQRIASSMRPGSQAARVGGDEFAILIGEPCSPQDCAGLARRIMTMFAEPIELGASKKQITVSIGIALCPHDAQTADGIINSADLALYRAKNEGRNRFCFFEQRMSEELRMRKTVEDDLRIAIEHNQLIMEYQPVVSLDGSRMVGVEALVRWRHPTKGTISPASFITLAEECGLILPLGEWVMRQALHQAKRWPDLRVAVNVSAIQFRQKNFVATVQKLLDESGVEATQLELELTESVLLADADKAEDAMIDLRAMGVRLALDDFGTGYSSLIYLRRFAFDKIKIDKSFLESTESTGESAIIVHSIVHLGRALGLTVTAEGVETHEQHRFMQALGCHELQGYLFSQPVSAAEIDKRRGESAPVELRSVA